MGVKCPPVGGHPSPHFMRGLLRFSIIWRRFHVWSEILKPCSPGLNLAAPAAHVENLRTRTTGVTGLRVCTRTAQAKKATRNRLPTSLPPADFSCGAGARVVGQEGSLSCSPKPLKELSRNSGMRIPGFDVKCQKIQLAKGVVTKGKQAAPWLSRASCIEANGRVASESLPPHRAT